MTKKENIINKTSSQVGIYIGLFYMQIYLAWYITIKIISNNTINFAICYSVDNNKNNTILNKEI